MVNLNEKIYGLALVALVVIFGVPTLTVFAADGDDFTVSDDYYSNQQRFGGTEMRAVSDDYEITGMLGEPADGLSSSADYLYNSGTIWRTTGTLSLEIVDAAYDTVASPAVTMTPIAFDFASQNATGSLGTDTQRVYWTNLDAADTTGYTITMAATDGPTDIWDAAGLTDYDFNDTGGATDGVDADAFGGQMTVDPTTGVITARTGYGSTTGISFSAADAFEEGAVDSITLVTASGSSDDYHAAYATGMGITQAVPASQAANTYTINMTLTIA